MKLQAPRASYATGLQSTRKLRTLSAPRGKGSPGECRRCTAHALACLSPSPFVGRSAACSGARFENEASKRAVCRAQSLALRQGGGARRWKLTREGRDARWFRLVSWPALVWGASGWYGPWLYVTLRIGWGRWQPRRERGRDSWRDFLNFFVLTFMYGGDF